MSDKTTPKPVPAPNEKPVAKLQRAQPDVYRLETIDVTRLYALLKDADRSKAIGQSIVKALITDVLRSKLGFDDVDAGSRAARDWERTSWSNWGKSIPRSVPQEVSGVLQTLLADVSLSEDELRIIRELDLKLGV